MVAFLGVDFPSGPSMAGPDLCLTARGLIAASTGQFSSPIFHLPVFCGFVFCLGLFGGWCMRAKPLRMYFPVGDGGGCWWRDVDVSRRLLDGAPLGLFSL